MEVNVHEAKTHLSRLLRRVAAGEEITISRAGRPVARLVAATPVGTSRPMGIDQGKIWIAEDFDARDPELEALFYAPLDVGPFVIPDVSRKTPPRKKRERT
jgi:prevent-host-death family protein